VLAAGVLPEWLGGDGEEASFGPAPTPWGPITVAAARLDDRLRIRWVGRWRGAAPVVVVGLAGVPAVAAASGAGEAWVELPWPVVAAGVGA
jgi:hypothetical protein